jgi:hypothetical protein
VDFGQLSSRSASAIHHPCSHVIEKRNSGELAQQSRSVRSSQSILQYSTIFFRIKFWNILFHNHFNCSVSSPDIEGPARRLGHTLIRSLILSRQNFARRPRHTFQFRGKCTTSKGTTTRPALLLQFQPCPYVCSTILIHSLTSLLALFQHNPEQWSTLPYQENPATRKQKQKSLRRRFWHEVVRKYWIYRAAGYIMSI